MPDLQNQPDNPIIHSPLPAGKTRRMRMMIGFTMAVIGLGAPMALADNRLGTNWDENALPDAKMAICFDCGVNDSFLEPNRALHQMMTDMKIVHSYDEFPGGHTQDHWGKSLPK